jgi:hypothetical protein
MPKPASLDLEVGVAWIRDTECGDEEEAYELFQDAMNASIAFAGRPPWIQTVRPRSA